MSSSTGPVGREEEAVLYEEPNITTPEDSLALEEAATTASLQLDAPTKCTNITKLDLLDLPLEIRLDIYEYLLPHSSAQAKRNKGRKCLRLDWTSHPTRSQSGLGQIASLASSCRQTRREIVPIFFHGVIVKFPAWNEDCKLQCLYWIDHVSETTVRSLDVMWLEGVYWRFCIRVGRAVDREWEEEAARMVDWRRFGDHVAFRGNGFALRVEFFEHLRFRAEVAGRGLFESIGNALDVRERKDLGRSELKGLIRDASLSGWESEGRSSGGEMVVKNLCTR